VSAAASSVAEVTTARTRLLLPAAILVTVLAWASAFVVIRGTGEHFHAGALALGRLLVGTAALSLLLVGRRWIAPTRREWLLLVSYGVGWFGVYNVALNAAEATLDAGTTAMLVNIGPILIGVGGALILREGMSRWLGIGFAVAFAGVVLIGISSGAGFGDGVGVLLALLAAITYAAGVLAQKPVLRRIPTGQATFIGCAIGAVVTLPFAPALVADLQAAPAGAILGVVYLGVVPTALAFTTWGYALGRMPASRLGISTYVVPPITIVMGLVAFGEVPAPLALVGGVVCLLGVALSRRSGRPAAVAARAEADAASVPERPGNLSQ
jgi:drug/metabolite transporter (DMT)-like permease